MLDIVLILTLMLGFYHEVVSEFSSNQGANSSKIQNPLTLRYDYSILGKNNSYEKRSEYATEGQTVGNFFIQLPQKESTSSVQYTANSLGFHPVVKLATKNKHSEVSSHFALGQSAVKSLNDINNQENTMLIYPNHTQYYDDNSTLTKDKENKFSINKYFSNMFAQGIADFLSTKSITEKLDDEKPSEAIEDVIYNENKFLNLMSPLTNNSDTFLTTKMSTNKSSPSEKEFHEQLYFGPFTLDSLQTNDVEKHHQQDVKINHTLKETNPILSDNLTYNINLAKKKILSIIYPESNSTFDSPIIVDDHNSSLNRNEQFEDNQIAASKKMFSATHLPPVEVNIISSQEKFINIPRSQSERLINVQILKELPTNPKKGEQTFTTNLEMDSYHEIAEKDFENEDNQRTTEAQSRTFLKVFNSKLSPHYENPELTNHHITTQTLHNFNKIIPETTSMPKSTISTKTNINLKRLENLDLTTSIPTRKNRGKTFVEIQKSINVHNLLIKEDKAGNFWEQHEEYMEVKKVPTQNNYPTYPLNKPIIVPDTTLSTVPSIPSIPSSEITSYSINSVSNNPMIDQPGPISSNKSLKDKPIYVENYDYSPKVNPYKIKEYVQNSHSNYPGVNQIFVNKEQVEKYTDGPLTSQYNNYISQISSAKQMNNNGIHEEVKFPLLLVKNTIEKSVEKTIDPPYPFEIIMPIEVLLGRQDERNSLVAKAMESLQHENFTTLVKPDHQPETDATIEQDLPKDIQLPYLVPPEITKPYSVSNLKLKNRQNLQNVNFNVPIVQHYQLAVPILKQSGNMIFSDSLYSLAHPTPPHINAVNFYNNHLIGSQLQALPNPFYRPFNNYQNSVLSQQLMYQQKEKHQSAESKIVPTKYANNYDYQIHPSNNILNYDYLGPAPPANDYSEWGKYSVGNSANSLHKRSSTFGRNLRLEYGFKPPLVPSIEIDDHGIPIDKKA